jgi:outer membrane murein-binding lipoprotein Lpp
MNAFKRLVVIAAAVVSVSVLAGCDKPISQQSCGELASTLEDIQDRLNSDDFDTTSEATKDADELNERVDELGGCPDEPSLQ